MGINFISRSLVIGSLLLYMWYAQTKLFNFEEWLHAYAKNYCYMQIIIVTSKLHLQIL